MNPTAHDDDAGPTPGEVIRTLRKRREMTLSDVSQRTGLAVSTISKLEKGQASLSYDKLVLLAKALEVDISELLEASPAAALPGVALSGRRIVHRAGEGQVVETASYRQTYLATELLNKKLVPIIAELRARTLDEFVAEFGGLIRHSGEEFVYVLDGEVEFHTDLYAPVRLRQGDSMYFDSTMGHAYLKGSNGTCRVMAVCSGRGTADQMLETFVGASVRQSAAARATVAAQAAAKPAGKGKGASAPTTRKTKGTR